MQEKQPRNKHAKKFDLPAFIKSPAGMLSIGVVAVIVVVIIYLVATFGNHTKPTGTDVSSLSISSKAGSGDDSSSSDEISSNLAEPTATDEETAQKFEDALEQNSDVIGWIKINGIDDIDLPVTQYDDNEYYLDRGLDRKDYYWGTTFADYRCTFSAKGIPQSRNTTLYGHNKGDYKYFANLVNYCDDPGLIDEAPYITYTTEAGDVTYRIFAAFFTEIDDPDFYYIRANPTDEEFQHFIDEAKERSEVIIDCDVDTTDRIMTLSTCTYRFKKADGTASEDVRCVVMARELRAGETVDDTLTPAKDNPNAKQPTYKK